MNTATRTLLRTLVMFTLLSQLAAQAFVDDGSVAVGAHTVYGADVDAIDRIATAIRAFEDAGLLLPRVTIHVHENLVPCGGQGGLFYVEESDRTIDLCSKLPLTILLELAHAWSSEFLLAETEQRFLDLHSITTWNDHDFPRTERGAEVVADTIAKGLQETPLPSWYEETAEILDEGFLLLTGFRSERYASAVESFAS